MSCLRQIGGVPVKYRVKNEGIGMGCCLKYSLSEKGGSASLEMVLTHDENE